jgi:dolichol-phosphate mannosyltransferase
MDPGQTLRVFRDDMGQCTLTDCTIIIPTYREADNIIALAQRISAINFGQRQIEVLLVDDDSQDGTAEIVHGLKPNHPWIQLITRMQDPGLSQSIIEGISRARYPLLIIMDADLSHPPEKIIEMLSLLANPNIDLVIGSRYITGGSTDPQWSFFRKCTSRLAAWTARKLLPITAKDPLSGFLAIRKDRLLKGDELKPIGWKIGLEIMIKLRCKNIKEVPIHFAHRRHGASKLTLKTTFDFFTHIFRLWKYQIAHK